MKKIKSKIMDFLSNVGYEIEYGLRLLCGRPSPMKRFITVFVIGGALAAANLYFVVSSIYNIGKHDAEKEFLRLQHIETLKLQPKSKKDSINNSNSKNYEYKQ
jgi:hypothetical protein